MGEYSFNVMTECVTISLLNLKGSLICLVTVVEQVESFWPTVSGTALSLHIRGHVNKERRTQTEGIMFFSPH